MKKYNQLLLAFPFLVLTGCASITSGNNQSVSVKTNNPGATCKLNNNKGTWYIQSTPGSVIVERSYENLNVDCEKGRLRGTSSVVSKTKGMAFGNILAGGIIGAAVDCGSGAAYDYPTEINVDLS